MAKYAKRRDDVESGKLEPIQGGRVSLVVFVCAAERTHFYAASECNVYVNSLEKVWLMKFLTERSCTIENFLSIHPLWNNNGKWLVQIVLQQSLHQFLYSVRL